MTEKVHLRKKRKYLLWLCLSFLCVVCATGIAFAQTPPANNSAPLVFMDISGSMGQGSPSKLQSAKGKVRKCLELTNSTAQVYGFYSYEGEPDVLRCEKVTEGIDGLNLPPNPSQTFTPLDKGLSKGFEILTSSQRETQLWFVTDEIFDVGTKASEAEMIRRFREQLQNEDFPWVCYYQFDDVPGRPYRMYMMIYYDKKHITTQEHDAAVKQFLGYVDGLSSKLGINAVLYKFHLPLREKTVLFNVSDMSPWKGGYAGSALNPAFDFSLYYRPQSFNMFRSKLTFDNEQRLSVKGFPQTDRIDSSQYQTKAKVTLEGGYTNFTPGDTIPLANVAYGKPISINLRMTNIPSLNLSLKDLKEVFFSLESGGNVTWDASFTVSDATFNPVEGKYPNVDMSKISEEECLPQTTKPQTLLLTYSFPVSYPAWVWFVRILGWGILIALLWIGIKYLRKAVSGQRSAAPTSGSASGRRTVSPTSGGASGQPIKAKQPFKAETKIFKKLP